ncbi:hypothetical protein LZ30DRAFT_189637 [Colletotrichum cereale]|nr:hypothetical protein LZ30DRAFT_189637 [Colletotrichum cereale]
MGEHKHGWRGWKRPFDSQSHHWAIGERGEGRGGGVPWTPRSGKQGLVGSTVGFHQPRNERLFTSGGSPTSLILPARGRRGLFLPPSSPVFRFSDCRRAAGHTARLLRLQTPDDLRRRRHLDPGDFGPVDPGRCWTSKLQELLLNLPPSAHLPPLAKHQRRTRDLAPHPPSRPTSARGYGATNAESPSLLYEPGV